MLNLGAQEWLVVLLLLAPLLGAFDAAIIADSRWAKADQSKVVWVLLMILFSWIGLIAYLAAVRRKL
jgi:hypothetical protein